ncbi:MAG: NAD(P)H-hydrate dehydratase [Bacteroidota bacterium]
MLLANTSQIRQADQLQIEAYQYPGILLMETAGRLTAERICERFPSHQPFILLIGPGNNGGDAWVIARILHLKGYAIHLICSHTPERYTGDAHIMYQIAETLNIPWKQFDAGEVEEALAGFQVPPVLIDGLLGTGVQSALRGRIKEVISFFREKDLTTLAIDLPSGINADSGCVLNEVLPAETTYTFQLPKVCHTVTPAALTCGRVEVLDIGIFPEVIQQLGIQREWLDAKWFRENIQQPRSDSHKGSMGHVLLVGGSKAYGGAISLSAMGAMHAGVGLCTCASVEVNRSMLLSHCPEAMFLGLGEEQNIGKQHISLLEPVLKKKKAICIGPGMGEIPKTAAFLADFLPLVAVPVVLDAGALSAMATNPHLWEVLPNQTIVTPHPGEMRQLMSEADVIHKRLECAEKLAREKGCVVVLKGQGTIIAGPERTYVNATGNHGMASGGTGDVLTGIIGSFLAQGYPAETAAALGAYIHGKAGDLLAEKVHQHGVLASSLAQQIGPAIQSLMQQ